MVQGQENWQLTLTISHLFKPFALILCGAVVMAVAGNAVADSALNGLAQIMGMSAMCWVLNQPGTTHTFRWSWLFATVWLLGSVWWLYISLHQYGGLSVAMTLASMLVLCAGLALYYACAMWAYGRYSFKLTRIEKNLCFAACWTLAELARAQWWTGFPWAAIGYAHVDGLLSYAAPWTGIYGVCFLAAFIASDFAQRLSVGIKKQVWLIGVVVFLCGVPAVRETHLSGPALSVNLLQANIGQDTKFNEGRVPALTWYFNAYLASDAELTVLPETALPYLKHELPQGYWEALSDHTRVNHQFGIIGIPTLDAKNGYGNSAIGMDGEQTYQYNKHHLVPFGEFTPKPLKWFTQMMSIDFGDFHRGAVDQPAFVWKDHKMAVTICYEDLFGEELAVRFNDPLKAPTLFVNLSNLAWFGHTSVVPQHIHIARMRSLEFQRPTVRATNAGGTVIIDAQGRVQKALEPFVAGQLQGTIHSPYQNVTFFARWAGHWGLKPMWCLCLGLVAWVVMRDRRLSKKIESVK